MDRAGNRSSHQYVLASGAAPEQDAAEPAPSPGGLNGQFADEERHAPPGKNHDDAVVREVGAAPRASSFDRTRHASEKYWLNEAGSCLVALGVLVAIICVLHRHDGQPLPEWRYGITLNALISVLSSVLKAAVVLPLAGGISQAKWLWYVDSRPLKDVEAFDDASRGPWGSLMLLFDMRSHYVASFGAFLTVVALAVDPFAQQVVQTQACMRQDASAVARVPRANFYDRNGEKAIGTNGQNYIYNPMAAAIYTGLLAPPDNATAVVSPVCPSGNCTFPGLDASYQSLAVCHRCENITDLVRNRTNGTTPWHYSLPSGPYLKLSIALSATVENIADFDLFNFEMLMFTNKSGPLVNAQVVPDLRLLGVRCSLSPCVKTYKAQVSKTVLQEQVLSVMDLPRDESTNRFTLVSDRVLRNGTLRSCATADDAAPGRQGLAARQASNVDTTRLPTEDCTWGLSPGPDRAIRNLLWGLFRRNTLQWQIDPSSAPAGDPWLQNIYRNGDADMASIDQFMGGLADSITGQIRSEGRGGAEGWAEGAIMYERTCVRVNWPWLAFPAALLVLVVVFVGLTVVATLRTSWKEHGLEGEAAARIGFLKSSPLALLFFGLQRDVLEDAGHPTTASRMQDVAQDTQVALKWSWYEGQWRFVKAKTEG